MVETPGLRPARLSSVLSDAVLLAPLLLRPFETADRVDPLADRTADRLDRAAPDVGMTRRSAGTQRPPPPQFVGLKKAAGERATDFLVPLTRKSVPQAFPLVLAEPSRCQGRPGPGDQRSVLRAGLRDRQSRMGEAAATPRKRRLTTPSSDAPVEARGFQPLGEVPL